MNEKFVSSSSSEIKNSIKASDGKYYYISSTYGTGNYKDNYEIYNNIVTKTYKCDSSKKDTVTYDSGNGRITFMKFEIVN